MSKKTGEDKLCQVCGTVFYVPGWRKGVKFCSNKCSGIGKPKRKGKPPVDVICGHCGVTYRVPEHRVKKTRFCSQKCVGLAMLPAYANKRNEAATAANKARALPPEVRKANKKAGLARWYQNNKASVAEYGAKRYAEKKDEIQERNKAWYVKNSDKISERGRAKRRDSVEGEKLRERRRRDYRDNKVSYVAAARRREADKIRATPAWADLDAIEEFYHAAKSLTLETGIPHVVDHVIPLRGKTVCGLHVENNLQVITKAANLEKGNRFDPEATHIWQEHSQ